MIDFKHIRISRVIYITLLFLVFHLSSLAQENNVWIIGGQSIKFELNFNEEPPTLTPLNYDNKFLPYRLSRMMNNQVITQSNELFLYSAIDTNGLFILNDRHQAVISLRHDGQKHSLSNLLVLIGDSLIIIDVAGDRGDGDPLLSYDVETNLYTTIYSIDSYAKISEQKHQQFRGDSIYDYTKGNLHLLEWDQQFIKYSLCSSDSIYLFTYDFKKGINTLAKTFSLGGFPIWLDPGGSGYSNIEWNNSCSEFVVSHSSLRKRIFSNESKDSSYNNNAYSHFAVSNNGEMEQLCYVERNEFFNSNNVSVRGQYSFNDIEFSPNDSFVYILTNYFEGNNKNPSVNYLSKYKNGKLIEMKKFSNSLYRRLKLAPNGKIYLFPFYYYDSYLREIGDLQIYCLENPNSNESMKITAPTQLDLKTYGYPRDIKGFTLNTIPLDILPYKRAEFTPLQLCAGLSSIIQNTSDSSQFVKYRFYFGDGDSADMGNSSRFKGKWAIEHIYNNTGKYFLKMKAFTSEGGWVWYSDTIQVVQPSIAKFSITDTIGCQWISFKYHDKSTLVNKGRDISYTWDFGDGSTYFELNPRTNGIQDKTYNTSGDYLVQLTIDDGYCIDSFSLPNKVVILPAPQPGITVDNINGCAPLLVTASQTYNDIVDSMIIEWGDSDVVTYIPPFDDIDISHTYVLKSTDEEVFQLVQRLHGPTGCVTSDTIEISVIPGLSDTDSCHVFGTYLENNQIQLNFNEYKEAINYRILRNGLLLNNVTSSPYIDPVLEPNSYEYSVIAVDSCGTSTSINSRKSRPIFLSGYSVENTVAVLNFNPYSDWTNKNNFISFELQHKVDNTWIPLYTGPYKDSILDLQFLSDLDTSSMGKYKCYRVMAVDFTTEIANKTYSNTLCLPYQPIMWIPNAFSPNNDKLNDVFRPLVLGIESYEVKIYDRWGQLITTLTELDSEWDANGFSAGTYMVTVEALGVDNKLIRFNQTLTLIR